MFFRGCSCNFQNSYFSVMSKAISAMELQVPISNAFFQFAFLKKNWDLVYSFDTSPRISLPVYSFFGVFALFKSSFQLLLLLSPEKYCRQKHMEIEASRRQYQTNNLTLKWRSSTYYCLVSWWYTLSKLPFIK